MVEEGGIAELVNILSDPKENITREMGDG